MQLDFKSQYELIPAIIQHAYTGQVLMLGYMNAQAFSETCASGKVTFYSRSKKRLWVKGETSGHYLNMIEHHWDCDSDTLLIKAVPKGPTCHTGRQSCFEPDHSKGFLYALEQTIRERISANSERSYTAELFRSGMDKIAQKVGEESVELVIESMRNDNDRFRNEAADLLYHFMILLQAKGNTLKDIETVLAKRSG